MFGTRASGRTGATTSLHWDFVNAAQAAQRPNRA
jgi:hypothetical protein